jgi:hypothetical protein
MEEALHYTRHEERIKLLEYSFNLPRRNLPQRKKRRDLRRGKLTLSVAVK